MIVAVPLKLASGVKVMLPPPLETQTPALAGLAVPWLRLVKLMVEVFGTSLVSTSSVVGVPGGQVPAIVAASFTTVGAVGEGRIVTGNDWNAVRPQLSVTVQVTTQLPAAALGVNVVVEAAGVEKIPPAFAVHKYVNELPGNGELAETEKFSTSPLLTC